jgi:acyl-CoA reductase-like NAD-dependent aldehyde dehydrogenase
MSAFNASTIDICSSVAAATDQEMFGPLLRIEAGRVWGNLHVLLAPAVPFGAIKQSGMGSFNPQNYW